MNEANVPRGIKKPVQDTVRLRRSGGRVIEALLLKTEPFVDTLRGELTRLQAENDSLRNAHEKAVLAFGNESMEATKARNLLELERTCVRLLEEKLEKLATEKKLLEKLLELRADFVAQMAHELKTPLSIIMGYTELLKDEAWPAGQKARDKLGSIENAGHRMAQTISMVLDFFKAEAGKLKVQRERADVGEEMAAVIRFMKPVASGRKVVLELDSPRGTYVELDPKLLHHVMVNLISNGIKYNRQDGTGNVTVAVKKKGDRVEISVSDTGIGIKKEDMPGLFNAFERLDGAKGIEGTGLGLVVVKRFTEMMDGTIGVESELGKGSAFTVSFPAAKE